MIFFKIVYFYLQQRVALYLGLEPKEEEILKNKLTLKKRINCKGCCGET
jgi:hypothetical protein